MERNSVSTVKRKTAVVVVMVALFTCLFATASFASWVQSINENGLYDGVAYNIAKIEVFQLAGSSSLESPGMSGFSAGSWTVQMPNSNYAVATNATPAISNVTWLFSFAGTSSDSISLAYLVYATSGQVFGTNLNYNYGGPTGWSFPNITNLDINNSAYVRSASSVPIPPAAYLLGAGLASLVGLRRRITT